MHDGAAFQFSDPHMFLAYRARTDNVEAIFGWVTGEQVTIFFFNKVEERCFLHVTKAQFFFFAMVGPWLTHLPSILSN